jgi:hypothetical protein
MDNAINHLDLSPTISSTHDHLNSFRSPREVTRKEPSLEAKKKAINLIIFEIKKNI